MRNASTAQPISAPDSSPSGGTRRREHQRFAVDLDVSLGSDHNFYAGFAENLSAGGVFVATHQIRPVGESVEVTVHLPDGTEIRAVGEVRWVRVFNADSDLPPGVGLRFRQLDEAANGAIERFLRQREPLFFDDD
jgi:uncharacterized protein (TIGR02266 family)